MDIGALIKEYGIYVGLMVAGIANYILLRERKTKSEAEALKAAVAQQTVITDKFTELFAENRALQAKLDVLEGLFNDAKIVAAQTAHELAEVRVIAEKQDIELKGSRELASALKSEVTTLTEKVAALESEKVSWAKRLDTERKQLDTANARIVELQTRVSTLEGENSAFKRLLDKLQVVSVDNDSPKE